MTEKVYRDPASRKRVPITLPLRLEILGLLRDHSQQAVARQLGIAQATVHRVAKAARTADQNITNT